MPFPTDGKYSKLGKGALFLDKLTNTGLITGYDFSENVTALTLAADVTKVSQFSSTEHSTPKIASATTRVGYTLTATMTAFTKKNLEKFLLGLTSTIVQGAAGAQVVSFTNGEGVKGRYLDVGSRQITNVHVTADGTEALVAGTDFKVETDSGLIHLLPGGSINDGDDIAVTFDRPALTIDKIGIARDSGPVCKLLFLADDSNQDGDGAKDRLEVWKVNVAPTGDLNFIGDDYGSFQLTMEIVSDAANHPDSPFGTLDRIRAA